MAALAIRKPNGNTGTKIRCRDQLGADGRNKRQGGPVMKTALKTWTALMAVNSAFCCGPAWADWRDDIGTFRIGIVAEPGAGNTVPGLARLTEAFTNALGLKVKFVVARDYAALID